MILAHLALATHHLLLSAWGDLGAAAARCTPPAVPAGPATPLLHPLPLLALLPALCMISLLLTPGHLAAP